MNQIRLMVHKKPSKPRSTSCKSAKAEKAAKDRLKKTEKLRHNKDMLSWRARKLSELFYCKACYAVMFVMLVRLVIYLMIGMSAHNGVMLIKSNFWLYLCRAMEIADFFRRFGGVFIKNIILKYIGW